MKTKIVKPPEMTHKNTSTKFPLERNQKVKAIKGHWSCKLQHLQIDPTSQLCHKTLEVIKCQLPPSLSFKIRKIEKTFLETFISLDHLHLFFSEMQFLSVTFLQLGTMLLFLFFPLRIDAFCSEKQSRKSKHRD